MSGKRRNFRITFTVAAVLLAGIAGLAISVTSDLRGARLDLTSEKRFTMSPAAAQVLGELAVPIQVQLYITPESRMPTELKNLERDITEQLANFERVSDGMLQFGVLNPQDDEELQDRLMQKGIRPFQVQSVDKDEFGVKLIWSALTIAYKDHPEEVIPQILPYTLGALESLVVGPVYRLTRENVPKVAVFAPLTEVDPQVAMMYLQQGMQPPQPTDEYARIAELLEQQHYEATRIELTEDSPIPADADLLLVLNPRRLGERQAFEINRALSNGIPTLMAVQAHTYNYSPAPRGGWSISAVENTTGLEDLLAGLGVSVVQDHFMDQSMQVLELPREVNLGGLRMQTREPVQAPIQILVTGDNMSDVAVTSHLGSLLYLWGTPVEVDRARLAENALAATTLMTSSDESWRVEFQPGQMTASMFDPGQHTMTGPAPLAVMVEGQFPDTFAGEVPAWPVDAAEDTAATATQGPVVATPLDPRPSRLIVVGCGKMFDDNVIQGAQNALLLANSVDYLAGAEELLSIRSRTLTRRFVEQVSAGEKLLWRFLAVLLVPVLVAAFGITRSTLRRREATRYRARLRRAPAV
ncbi:MAG: GldG family protein [Candidatus Krumholzibacteriia bacterium]